MSLLTACYKFELLSTVNKDKYMLKRIFKVGNNEYFNDFFEQDNLITYKKVSPIEWLGDYIVYSLRYGDHKVENRLITFNTGLIIHPYGEIKIPGCTDCILGKEAEPNTFEIYVFEKACNFSASFLNMLIDGSLLEQIDKMTASFY